MNETPLQYSMLIEWSEKDQAYLVTLPEWADRVIMPITHGDTYSEAVQHGQEVRLKSMCKTCSGNERLSRDGACLHLAWGM